MKKIIFLFIIFFSCYDYGLGQCTADAGPDSMHLCSPDPSMTDYVLGGSPTAPGGIPPFTYQWSVNYATFWGRKVTSEEILDDPKSANPLIKNIWWEAAFGDSLHGITFYLQVKDSLGQICTDSIFVSHTAWVSQLGDCRTFVGGRIIGIHSQTYGGVHPLTFEWSPKIGLVSPYSRGTIASPDTFTRYTVVLTDSKGCTAIDGCTVYITSSINQNAQAQSHISISPNPFYETTQIQLHRPFVPGTFAEIIDVNGKVILTKYFQTDRMMIKSQELPAGIYFCRIREEGKVLGMKKMIVLSE